MIDLKKIVKDPRLEKTLISLCSSAIQLSKEISLSDSEENHRLLVGTNSDGDAAPAGRSHHKLFQEKKKCQQTVNRREKRYV